MVAAREFSDDGAMFLVEAYLRGARTQLDRYRENVALRDGNAHIYIFSQLHEVSNLLEDLDCIALYFEKNNLENEKHKTWKQARHHVRHDIRDKMAEVKRKRKRLKFLQVPAHLNAQIFFRDTEFTIGGIAITLNEIEVYLDWANDEFGKYVKWLVKYERSKPVDESKQETSCPNLGAGFSRTIY